MFGASLLIFLLPIFGTTIQSNICALLAPAFTTANATTTASTYVMSGTTSPSVALAIMDNGQTVANVTSDSSGNFSLQVSLSVGNNSFTATASSNCTVANSQTPLVLIRTTPPVVSPLPPTIIRSLTTFLTHYTTATGSGTVLTPTALPVPGRSMLFLHLNIPASAWTKAGAYTTHASVFVRGHASAGAQITLSDNGHLVARLTAAADGSFGVAVPLVLGRNSVTVQASLNGQTTVQTFRYNRIAPMRHHSSTIWWWIGGISFLLVLELVVVVLLHRRRKGQL